MKPQITIFSPLNYNLIKDFITFPKLLYYNDSNYIPPLDMTLIGNKLLNTKGLLFNNHPFHQNSFVRYILASLDDDKSIVGRLAFGVDFKYNDFHKKNTAFFGFFDVINDFSVAKIMFDHAIKTLKEQMKVNKIIGPLNFSTNYTIGLLIEGYNLPPYINTPYNYPYYKDFLAKYGFVKEKDILAFQLNEHNVLSKGQTGTKRIKQIKKLVDRVIKKYKVSIRHINLSGNAFMNDMNIIRELYTKSWHKNWGFVPMDSSEFIVAAHEFKSIVKKELVLFAYIDNKPVGFIALIPDINNLLLSNKSSKNPFSNLEITRLLKVLIKKGSVTKYRIMLLGVLPEYRKQYIEMILYYKIYEYVAKGVISDLEFSWILEDNALMINTIKNIGGTLSKTWRIFSFDI